MINFVAVVISGSRSDEIPVGYVPIAGPSGTFYMQAISDAISDSVVPFLTGAAFSGPVTATILLGPGSTGQFSGSVLSASYADFALSSSFATQAVSSSIATETDALLDASPFVVFSGSTQLSSSRVLQSSDGTVNVDTSVAGQVNLSVASPFFVPMFNGLITQSASDVVSSMFGGGHIDTTELAGFISGTFDALVLTTSASLSGVFELYDDVQTGSIAVLTASTETTGTFQLFSTPVVIATGSHTYSVFARADNFGSGSLQISMSRVKLTS